MQFIIRCYLLLVVLQLIGVPFSAIGQSKNSAFIAGDFADPSIIRSGGLYYATATSSEWAPHFPVYVSADLKSWKQTGYVFDKTPGWTSGSFWAPEYYQIGKTYYIYYTARRKKDGISCIGVATSAYPDKGFQDHGVLVELGKEAIDPFVYKDNGRLYITFKAYGLDGQPIEIVGRQLSADGLRVEGELFSLLKDDNRIGMEGQSILKHENYYYLFYSAGDCCGTGCSYNVRVARSKNFTGPYEKYDKDPLLKGDSMWSCTGHGTFVSTPDHAVYYLHHAYLKNSNVFTGRQGLLARLSWPASGSNWPVLTELENSTETVINIKDTFSTTKLASFWQWDFRNASPDIIEGNGKLTLSGTYKATNQTGIALTVRPVSDHFEISTTVVNSNAALKGLVFYGDASAAAGIGVRGNEVELWMVHNNIRKILAKAGLGDGDDPVILKFVMQPDKTCKAFYHQSSKAWQELRAKGTSLDVSFLPQWDRSPRPGLLFNGKPEESAVFSTFELVNLK